MTNKYEEAIDALRAEADHARRLDRTNWATTLYAVIPLLELAAKLPEGEAEQVLRDAISNRGHRAPSEPRRLNWHQMNEHLFLDEPFGNVSVEVTCDSSTNKWMFGVYDDGAILFESQYAYETSSAACERSATRLHAIEQRYARDGQEFTS